MKRPKHFIKWVETIIRDKKITLAQYFYDSPYGKNKYTITIEKGYKPKGEKDE